MKAAEFDHVAEDYDDVFTNSEIGKRQRARVHEYLEEFVLYSTSLRILELNCGTGEDAIWLAKKGYNVVATDVSSAMLSRTRAKAHRAGVGNKVTTRGFDLSKPQQFESDTKFDVIFSNFGGLNCLSPQELDQLMKRLSQLLAPEGKLIFVVMPRVCHWERFYFLLKANPAKMNRRKTDGALPVHVDGKMVNTWYYNAHDFTASEHSNFVEVRKRPIAYAVPPSFMEPFFVKKKRFLKALDYADRAFGQMGFLASYSDHYIIELKRFNENI